MAKKPAPATKNGMGATAVGGAIAGQEAATPEGSAKVKRAATSAKKAVPQAIKKVVKQVAAKPVKKVATAFKKSTKKPAVRPELTGTDGAGPRVRAGAA